MLYIQVSVFDSALGAFGRPISVQSSNVAVRSFIDQVNRPDDSNEMYKHPQDFDLYHVGSFNDSDGSFESVEPSLLVRAVDVIKQE